MDNAVVFLKQKYESALVSEGVSARFVTLVTMDEQGLPASRVVTIRAFTNTDISISVSADSPKIDQLKSNQKWELTGLWPKLLFQFRIRGEYEIRYGPEEKANWHLKPVASRVLDVYHENLRPQSSRIESREQLISEVAALRRDISAGLVQLKSKRVSTLLLRPTFIETWEGSDEDRLHDRSIWELIGLTWRRSWLVP